jgi:thioesterase domain-containing protein/acyl carrier protein
MNNRSNNYIDRISMLSGSQRKLLAEQVAAQNGSQENHKGPVSGLAAYVVLHKGEREDAAALRESLKTRLPDYMIPSSIVVLDSMPLMPNGKVDRKLLTKENNTHSGPEKPVAAPRDTLETQLAKIWEKVLSIQNVGIRDNFFELGGHSLLAVQLVAEIKKEMGKDLTIMVVFNAPTIEQMAKIIMEGVRALPSDTAQPNGSKLPLFWVSGSYFMRHLDHDQPVKMLIEWEEHGLIPQFSSVEEIAGHCAERLLAEQPEGPYILGGYCFWGAVALEMGRQLIKQGHEVPLLFIVDTSFDYVVTPSRGQDRSEQDYTFKSRIMHHARTLMRLGNTEKREYILRKVSAVLGRTFTVNKAIEKIKVAICRSYLFFGRPVPRPLVRFYVYTLYASKLMYKYIYKDYPGRVVLINADGANSGFHRDWLERVEGEVSVHVVPEAQHLDMVNEPYVGVWAKVLNNYLNKIRRSNSGMSA